MDFSKEAVRLQTFINWRGKTDARRLAHAGFHYLGYGDSVECFACGTVLKDWQTTDNPWYEHARLYPNCNYIKLCMGKEKVDAVYRTQNKNRGVDVVDAVMTL